MRTDSGAASPQHELEVQPDNKLMRGEKIRHLKTVLNNDVTFRAPLCSLVSFFFLVWIFGSQFGAQPSVNTLEKLESERKLMPYLSEKNVLLSLF